MHDFASSTSNQILPSAILAGQRSVGRESIVGITNFAFIIFLILFGLVYLLFCLYLTIDMVLAMGHARLASLPIVQKLFSVSTTQGNYSIHADEDDDDSSEMSDVEGGDEEVSQRPDGN